VKGDIEDVCGTTLNTNVVSGPFSYTVVRNIDTLEIVGRTFGMGPPAPIPIQASLTGSFTRIYTIRDLINFHRKGFLGPIDQPF